MKKLIALTLVLLMVAGCSAPSLTLGLGMVAIMSGGDASADAFPGMLPSARPLSPLPARSPLLTPSRPRRN